MKNEIKLPLPILKLKIEDAGNLPYHHYFKLTFDVNGKTEVIYVTDFSLWYAFEQKIKNAKESI